MNDVNKLIILNAKGQIEIDVDQIIQNMYGNIMAVYEGKHFKLKDLMQLDFSDEEE